jgi:hypothetical protein
MKKSILFLLAIFCISISCKKEGTKLTQFSVYFNERADSIYKDSISYAIFNYSDVKELKDSSAINNPEVFSQTVKVERPYTLSLTAGHTYVLKKFELFSKSGNLLFYIPYRTSLNAHSIFVLPFIFNAIDGGYSLGVVKKN